MRKHFIASLVMNGILGGAISANDTGITYHTGKLTVSPKYRKLEMRYKDILSVSLGRLLFLPLFTIKMNNHDEYQFIIFNKKAFTNLLNEMGVKV